MKRVVALVSLLGFLAVAPVLLAVEKALLEVPVKGVVTMVDLGGGSCISCKMMAPIIRELEREYEGKAAVLFIDVYKNPEAAVNYDINVVPTQIFYDKDGKEVSRHEGFMDKKSIIAMLRDLGVRN